MTLQSCKLQVSRSSRSAAPRPSTRITGLRFAIRRALLVMAVGSMAPAISQAADVYVQPQAELRAEYNDNFGLQPTTDSNSDVYGFIADAQALIGIATPRSDTSLRPRVRLQEYPNADDLPAGEKVKPFEAFLDLRSTYEWQRSDLLVIARYSSQDSYNSETPSGVFDPLDPSYSGSPDSLRVRVGETRNRFEFRPRFEYEVTERLSAGIGIEYQTVDFQSDSVSTQTDYDYTLVDGLLSWSLSELSKFSVGAYASQYQTKNESTETDAYGGSVGYEHRWSEVTGFEAELFYEQNDVSNYFPIRSEESTSGWGGSLTGYRKLEVSEWRLVVERSFIPTGEGGKAESDQIRLQYDRDLGERLTFQCAGRFETRNSLTQTLRSDDRDYARVDVSLEWLMAPTWYLKGGYSYLWEDRERAISDADNNRLFISVGYRGLSRKRR